MRRRVLVVLGVVALAGGAFAFGRRGVNRIATPMPPLVTVHREPFARKVGAEGNLKAVKSTPIGIAAGVNRAQKIAWMVPDGSPVKKGDIVIRFDATEVEKKLRDSESERATADAKIGKEQVLADSAVRGRERTADLAGVELKSTTTMQNTDPTIFSRNQIIESEIDGQLAGARMDHATAAKGIEGSLSSSKVALIDVERRSAETRITQARRDVAQLEVHAPDDGLFVLEADWRGNLPRIGDSFYPGQPIASLPSLESMDAEIFVLEADAAGLQVGNPASVVLEAHPETLWDGKIKRIDTLAKPRLREVPIQYFGVTLSLAKTDISVMKPGERVRATLTVDQREAIAVPRQAVFDKEGRTVVYRRQSGKLEPVTVKLGPSTLGRVVIEEGLADGDEIALRDPTAPATTAAPASSGAPKK